MGYCSLAIRHPNNRCCCRARRRATKHFNRLFMKAHLPVNLLHAGEANLSGKRRSIREFPDRLKTTARSLPAASMEARTSSISCSNVGRCVVCSESRVPVKSFLPKGSGTSQASRPDTLRIHGNQWYVLCRYFGLLCFFGGPHWSSPLSGLLGHNRMVEDRHQVDNHLVTK
jgi:hypothetical protein